MVPEALQGGNAAAVTSITDRKFGLAFVSLADLLNEPDEAVQYVVHDLLPAGGTSLLAGKPKAGKSTLARCLALCVARGDNWLGRECRQGTVLYLGLEEKRSEVRRHFADSARKPSRSSASSNPHRRKTRRRCLRLLSSGTSRPSPLSTLSPDSRASGTAATIPKSRAAWNRWSTRPRVRGSRRACPPRAEEHGGRAGDDALGSVAYMGGVDCGHHLAAGERWRANHP